MTKILSLKNLAVSTAVCLATSLWFWPKKGKATSDELVAAREIRFALYSVPDTLNVTQHADVSMFTILSSVHMGLLTEDYQGNLYSGAASSWTVSGDGLKYTFVIDTSLKFHNGKSLTCADVLYTFDRLRKVGNKFTWRSIVTTIACPSEDKAEFTLAKPTTSFLPALAGLESSILPASLGEGNSTVIGLGPYKLVFPAANTKVPQLLKVAGHPFLRPTSPDVVTFKLYSDFQRASKDFDEHAVDIVPVRSASDDNSRPNLVDTLGYSRLWFLLLGEHVGAKMSQQTRRCLFRNVDRVSLASAASNSRGSTMVPAFGVVPPQSPGAISAVQKLAASCGSNASGLTKIEVIFIEGQVGAHYLDQLSKGMKDVGYEPSFHALPKPEFIDRLINRKFEAAVASYGLTVAPELNLRNFYGSDTLVPFAPKTGPFYDAKVEEVEASVTEVERAAKINSLQNLVASNPYFIPLTFQRMTYLVNPCLDMEGVRSRTAGEQFQDISLLRKCEGAHK